MTDDEYELLRRTWFPVARIEDVDQGPQRIRLLGSTLVVFRAGGMTTVAHAACPHRGMDLSMGEVRDDTLVCPYHGWAFAAGDGRCVDVPSLPPGSPPTRTELRVLPVTEAHGHVWSALEEPLLPVPALADTATTPWHLAYGPPTPLRCGMRQLTENFRDMAHFPFVHGESMGPHVRRVVDPYQVHRDGWDLEWTLSTDLGGTALDGNRALGTTQTLTYHLTLPMTAWIRTVFPDGGRRLVAQFATPAEADGTAVTQFWVVGVDDVVVEEHGVSLAEMWDYELQVFTEDHPIVENQEPVEAPLDSRTQAHTRADKYSLVYRRAYLDLIEHARAAHRPLVEAI